MRRCDCRLAFEPRFKLLPMYERKEAFVHFVRHRAGELREEKREAATVAAQVLQYMILWNAGAPCHLLAQTRDHPFPLVMQSYREFLDSDLAKPLLTHATTLSSLRAGLPRDIRYALDALLKPLGKQDRVDILDEKVLLLPCFYVDFVL